MRAQRTLLQIILCVLSTLLLVACATSTSITGTRDSGQALIKYKQQTLAEVGQFEMDQLAQRSRCQT